MVQRPRQHNSRRRYGRQRVQPLGAPDDDPRPPGRPPDPGLDQDDAGEEEDAALVVGNVGPAEQMGEEGVQLAVLAGVIGVVGLK